MKIFGEDIVRLLQSGGVGIIPTDTLYGMVTSVWKPQSIERGYALRNRDFGKACIVLIADISDLDDFSIMISEKERVWLDRIWPGKVSVMLPCVDEQFRYLSRGTDHLVFRIPDDEVLRVFLRETGPLIAPSANPQGEKPAESIEEATKYFGDAVDFFVDGGILRSKPSTIVRLENDYATVVRSGVIEIKEGKIN